MPGVFQAHFAFRLETSPIPMSSAKMTITFGRAAGAKAARPIPTKPRKPTTPKNQPWSQPKRQPGPRPRSQKRDRMGISLTLPIASPFDQPRIQPHAGTDSKSTQPQRIEARPPKGQAPKRPSGSGSGRSEHWNVNTPTPSRRARKLILPRVSSASGALIPRSPPKPQRSGVGPERALEANTPTPRAQRESSSFPEPTQRPEA